MEAYDTLLEKLCEAFDDGRVKRHVFKCYEHRVLPTPGDGVVTRVHMCFGDIV